MKRTLVVKLLPVLAASVLLGVTGCSRNQPKTEASAGTVSSADASGQKHATRIGALGTGTHVKAVSHALTRVTTSSRAVIGQEKAITGRVTLSDGSPAEGTTITARTFRAFSGQPDFDNMPVVAMSVADGKGNYRISPIEGALLLEAAKPGYGVTVADLGVRPTAEGLVATKLVQNLQLKPAIPVEGLVVDPKGSPVSGATVKARAAVREPGFDFVSSNFITTSSAEGRFRIDGFSAASVAVVASAEGMGYIAQTVKAPSSEVRLVLPAKGAHIEGTITRKETGDPVSAATVRFINRNVHGPGMMELAPGMASVTDSAGHYRIDNLPKGSYGVFAEAGPLRIFSNESPGSGNLAVKGTESTLKHDLQLYAGHTVSGTITDRKTGKPLDEVTIAPMLVDEAITGTLLTAADGKYEIQHLFPMEQNKALLSIRREGYSLGEPNQHGIPGLEVALDQNSIQIAHDIQLVPNVTISGTVETPEGMGIANCAVTDALRTGREAPDATPLKTDSDGHFELKAQPMSEAVVQADLPGYPSARTTVQVRDDSITGTKIVLLPGAQIQGTVVAADNAPIPKASVQVMCVSNRVSQNPVNMETDGTGAFSSKQVPPGFLTIVADASGYLRNQSLKVKLAAGETTTGLRIVLEKGHTIAGTVTDISGKPITGATVSADASKNQTYQGRVYRSQGETATTKTDELGHYRIEGLEKVAVSLSVNAEKYLSDTKAEVAVDQDNIDFSLKDKQSAKFTGTVLESDTEKPISDFKIDGAKYEPVADQPNQFVLTELSQGDNAGLIITAPGHVKLEAQVTIPVGQPEAAQTFHLRLASKIIGRVIGKSSREPLANVSVVLEGNQRSYYSPSDQGKDLPQTQTDSDGRFTLDGAESGNMTVAFNPSAPYSKLYIDVPVEAGKTADMGDVELDSGGSITGHVISLPGDKPVGNIALQLRGSRAGVSKSATTAGDGSFSFDALPNDSYSISGKKLTTVQVIIEAANHKDVTLRIGSQVLNGTVVRAGQPVPQAQVIISQGTYGESSRLGFQTDENGKFTANTLTPGTWNVQIYASDGGQGSRWTNDTVDIPETGSTDKTFVLPSGKLVGVVVDQDGKPVAEAIVTAKSESAPSHDAWNQVLPGDYSSMRAQSGADGTFSIAVSSAGKYLLTATKKGTGQSDPTEVDAPLEGESGKVTLTLKPVQTGTLVSVALNMTTGGPIKDAWCILWNGNDKFSHNAVRGDDGIMTIPDIPVGTYRVQVSSFGFAVNEHQVTIEAGKTAHLEDVLYEAGAVRLAVQDKNGAPIANADCTLTPNDSNSIEQPRHGTTDATGLWVVRGLYPGSYSATAMASGKTPGKGSTSVVAHQPVDLVIKLE